MIKASRGQGMASLCAFVSAAMQVQAQCQPWPGRHHALAVDVQMGKWDQAEFCTSGSWPSWTGRCRCCLRPRGGCSARRGNWTYWSWMRHGYLGAGLCFCPNKSCHFCSHPLICESPKCFSGDSMEELLQCCFPTTLLLKLLYMYLVPIRLFSIVHLPWSEIAESYCVIVFNFNR